ncbi:PDZ domain-containing protein [Saccharothrix tamanrassetensis]|uniref:endopeptidase La n=1 Tax=Saccharothrix tamanrassetensis TaxID=1051531 RepID=A0A841CJB0_9PSEU|nr:PDZ domain-containing protein [Saccharothrix tamanrassetensis]MBB5957389.1 PDZ domain-containing protein [Saccharothrix tamanrassetensis]
MSEGTDTVVEQPTTRPALPRRGLTRRTWTLVISLALVLALGLLGGFARVPYVALGPGPTYDTLGRINGTDVVHIEGQETFPTKGALTMTTVSLTDDVSLFGALGLWVSGRYALAPRDEFFRPGESEQQVRDQNVKAFQDSQTSAEVAALRYLDYPMKVVAAEITKESAADNVIQPNDRLLAVNGKDITSYEDVRAALETTKPGDQVDITFQRESARQTARITLGKTEDRPTGFLGVLPVDRADVPFDIKISLTDVGGPSAGLLFALSIVDKLTPGELNGGQSVAGTGEINDKGEVGRIGGINFKMVAAREAGATTFLVPAGNCDEAKQHAPEGMRLVKVEKLADAVESLKAINDGKDAPSC